MDIGWIAAQFPTLLDLRPLAKGGQKSVFAARHPTDGHVVLKLLLRTSDEQRLEREVLAGQLVDSERVPRVFETGEIPTPLGVCIWLREQQIAGVTLRARLSAGPLPFADVLRLGMQLLATLAQAEAKRIVHRDIKPENMMVDGSGDFWLLDFGLARHLDLESLTATKLPWGMGTLGYSPPEQMRNRKRDIDGRTDLFAVGVLLYECATGVNPFRHGAPTAIEVLRRVEHAAVPRLQIPGDVGGALADLVSTLVQKFPSQRPRTVATALAWMREIESSHQTSAVERKA